jgi:catechol 2,3-dioxygenase-like lactoylglutathione lyase family enzyme
VVRLRQPVPLQARSNRHASRVFDHVTIRVSDREASERFYETVLAVLGYEKGWSDERLAEWGTFSLMVAAASDEKPVTRGIHLGFQSLSRDLVDEFWRVGTEAGYTDDGPPGLRPQYGDDYYGSFLLDPDGNSAEAAHHGTMRGEGPIDHIWIRVRDVAASKRFYEAVAAHAGFRLNVDTSHRAQFVGEAGSFSVVAGEPTEALHLAFPAETNAAVDEFHRALTKAGYADNGPPGERPIYHEGYYGGFVRDPDGNNVELVNHNRGP